MQQVLLSKFFICGLLMGIVSFVNGQLLQKYHTNQAFGNPNPTFVLLDTFLDKYGIWLIFALIFFCRRIFLSYFGSAGRACRGLLG